MSKNHSGQAAKPQASNKTFAEADEDTIQRCPHDRENPYAQISRDFCRDTSISPVCKTILLYLLSMSDKWTIRIPQVVRHFQGCLSKDMVYAGINEALDSGYMKRESFKVRGLQRYRYFLSEFKKFCTRLEKPDMVEPDLANPDTKKNMGKKEQPKNPTLPLGTGSPLSLEIVVESNEGNEAPVSQQQQPTNEDHNLSEGLVVGKVALDSWEMDQLLGYASMADVQALGYRLNEAGTIPDNGWFQYMKHILVKNQRERLTTERKRTEDVPNVVRTKSDPIENRNEAYLVELQQHPMLHVPGSVLQEVPANDAATPRTFELKVPNLPSIYVRLRDPGLKGTVKSFLKPYAVNYSRQVRQ